MTPPPRKRSDIYLLDVSVRTFTVRHSQYLKQQIKELLMGRAFQSCPFIWGTVISTGSIYCEHLTSKTMEHLHSIHGLPHLPGN